MKKTFRFALMAALTVGLSLAVTSCKDDDESDDDNNGGTGEEQTAEETAAERAETFWSVAANLVNPFEVTDDYENKTFEPTIGKPLEGSTTIRVVSTGGLSAAAQRFADLTGAPVDENTSTYTYRNDAVGTLVYTKTNDGTSLATVDVSIKQIPHLQQIVYKTPEQMGTNGTFRGNSYYSFGDIILRYNKDNQPEYWVCVRPALGPAGKEDTHWMTVSKLPQNNLKLLEENLSVVAQVPTQLGKNEEHMQNLAEMLYAMFNPEQWQLNIEQHSSYGILGAKGLPIFHDMKPERVQYFNKYFWTLLEKDWEKNELFQMIFGYSAEQMKSYVNSADGLFLLGRGYTGKVGLYQWNFKNGDGSKSNLHDMKYSVVKKTGNALENAKLYYGEQYNDNHWVNEAFFGDPNPRFVIRIATGKQLAGQDPGPRFSLATATNGITDTFVFNNEHNVTISPNIDPKVYTDADVNPDMVKNKKDDETAVYLPGDLVMDEEGSYWMCIYGAGRNNAYGLSDQTAWFVSFDNITAGANGLPDNIVKEDEVDDWALRLNYIFYYTKDIKGGLTYEGPDNLGMWKNAYDHGNIDVSKLFCEYDTVWHFHTDKDYDSPSHSYSTNVAYIGNDGQLKLMRCIGDMTYSGHERTSGPVINGHKLDYMKYAFYKHYEVYDTLKMAQLTDEEKNAQITLWQKRWPISNDEMRFRDLYDQDMVSKYAANDKWVRLPETYTKQRRKPRTTANSWDIVWQDYLYKRENRDFANPAVVSMFNEPILFMRVMKVTDNGGLRANLTSQDGRKLTVVKLSDAAYLYQNMVNALWNLMMKSNLDDGEIVLMDNEGWRQ